MCIRDSTISDKYFLLSRRVDLLLLKSLRAKVCAYLLSEAEVHHSQIGRAHV